MSKVHQHHPPQTLIPTVFERFVPFPGVPSAADLWEGVGVAELPSGTVTFLFTDLEGSTRLWEEHPDAMRAALARHDEILRERSPSTSGHVVKTTGDGIHAVFATAHDALDAAVAMQLGLAAESFGETGPLRVRMGVHTCEAEYRDGDYFGSEVNRAGAADERGARRADRGVVGDERAGARRVGRARGSG